MLPWLRAIQEVLLEVYMRARLWEQLRGVGEGAGVVSLKEALPLGITAPPSPL